MAINTVGIIGKGALGLLYADLITQNRGIESVSFIMDASRLEKHQGQPNDINGRICTFQMVSFEEAPNFDLVIFAVKAPALEEVIQKATRFITKDTYLVSVLNGITSEEKLAAQFGWDRIIPCVAQGMDAMCFGNEVRYTQKGALHIGCFEQTSLETLNELKSFFENAGVPYVLENDIRRRMWIKFMANVGLNQTCAAYGINYGQLIDGEGLLAKGCTGNEVSGWRTYIAAMRETLAVANALGIALNEDDLNDMIDLVRTFNPAGTPSMGQDRINKKPCEVDEFSGVIIKLARKHGLAVPENSFLNAKIKEIEASYLQ